MMKQTYEDGDTVSYRYDDNGNILSVTSGGKTTSYTYDSANQLIREDNEAAGKIWIWTYDNAGNITSRKEYAYSTGTSVPAEKTVNYAYGDSSWGDLLKTYDGKTITYDAIGNPKSDGTWNYEWVHGRELASMSNSSGAWNFTYNADGLRTQRTNGSTTYHYVYNGDKLSQMTVGNKTLTFSYDAGGAPMTVNYNGAIYYYVTNVQGDVIAILDCNKTTVAEYTYDAWGRILDTDFDSTIDIGTINPLRYRGYVYDTEVGLYYLQSRYYNPTTGRFLNADNTAYLGADGTLLSYNLFAYCKNNPVMGYDPIGHWDWSWQKQAALGTTVLLVGLAILLAPPTGGASLGALAISASTIVAVGGAATITGTVMVGDAIAASISEANGKPTSRNQMQKQVESGKAPKEVDRVDGPHNDVNNSQNHIHFKDKTAINQDGSLSHEGKGKPNITRQIKRWILDNGWNLPKF